VHMSMTPDQMNELFAKIQSAIESETPKGVDEAKFQMVTISGLLLVQSLLLDVNRAASALEELAHQSKFIGTPSKAR